MLITQAPKGTKDLLPKDVYRWQHMEAGDPRTDF